MCQSLLVSAKLQLLASIPVLKLLKNLSVKIHADLAQAGRPEELACIVASLHRPELTLDLFRHKPKNHRKGEQTTQEDEIHEQGCRQGGLLCHLCTYKLMVSFNPLENCSVNQLLQRPHYAAGLGMQRTIQCKHKSVLHPNHTKSATRKEQVAACFVCGCPMQGHQHTGLPVPQLQDGHMGVVRYLEHGTILHTP